MPFLVTTVTVVLFGLHVYVLVRALRLLMQSDTRRQSNALNVAFWTAFISMATLAGVVSTFR